MSTGKGVIPICARLLLPPRVLVSPCQVLAKGPIRDEV
jgi:hypothetical protein